jgi:hypothetical protein
VGAKKKKKSGAGGRGRRRRDWSLAGLTVPRGRAGSVALCVVVACPDLGEGIRDAVRVGGEQKEAMDFANKKEIAGM